MKLLKYAIKNTFGFTALTQLIKAKLEFLEYIEEQKASKRMLEGGMKLSSKNNSSNVGLMISNVEFLKAAQTFPNVQHKKESGPETPMHAD